MSYSEQISNWATSLHYNDLPDQVVNNTRLRVLDVIGLALAGLETNFGQSVRQAALELAPDGCSHILGSGDATTVTSAAFTNGALSQALEFDDTHNLSVVHMSSPSVAAALALAERDACSGQDLITAIALGNEISCRVGSVITQQFHRRGFHPTGLFSAFGSSWLAAWLLNLNATQMTNAAGIVGSYAAGLLQCWVDGTQSKFLHPGWAAQSGINAATLAKNGGTGPLEVFEGRFGLFASHIQDESIVANFPILTQQLGDYWESENASFKPFPLAHVIHPYVDALFRLIKTHNIKPEQVDTIACPVAEFIVGIVCEPVAEKRRPLSDSHGRVSLQYSLAEAFVNGKMNKNACSKESLTNPEILQLADRVEFYIDENFPGPEQFKAQVCITLKDGRSFTEVEEYNRGSKQNPMPDSDIIAKFNENAEDILSLEQRERLIEKVLTLDKLENITEIIMLAIKKG